MSERWHSTDRGVASRRAAALHLDEGLTVSVLTERFASYHLSPRAIKYAIQRLRAERARSTP